MRIFAILGIILMILILFTSHVLLVTKDIPDNNTLPSLESSLSILAPMSAMPQLFSPEEQRWIDEHPVITVSLAAAFISAESPDSVNAYTGISLDFLRLLSRIIGIQFRVEPHSNWSNALEEARQWRVDIFAMSEPLLAADTGLLLTTPYVLLPGIILTRDGEALYTSLDELNGKRVSVRYHQFWHDYLEKNYPDIQLDPVSNTLQGLFRVLSGQTDAMVGYSFSILPRLTENTHLNFRISATIPSHSGLSMAVRSDWPEFHTILSKALKQISSEETENITSRWLNRKPQFRMPPRSVWMSLLALEGVGAVLLLSLFWNFQLRRKVEERTNRLTAELQKSAKAEDLEKLNAELRQAMRVAAAATEAKSRFLANISHEIRTPLHGIIAFTELACLKDNPLPRNHLRTVLDLSYALLDIVNDTLDFSKIEAGQMDMDSAPFMLDEVILRVCDMTMRGSMARYLECVVDIEPSTPLALVGDAGRLQQILTNLMGNAIKFTPPGGRIHLQVRQGGTLQTTDDLNKAQFLFFVHDTGVGITPEQLPQLFQPFKQADSSLTRRHGGTGLGLSIARYMVENMGGEIWVESEAGQGSTFAFSLRLGLQEQVEVLAGTTFMGLQALVAGASELGARTIGRTLEALGIQPVNLDLSRLPNPLERNAEDIAAACTHWEEQLAATPHPDLILIDRLRVESSCPASLELALFLENRLSTPVPVILVGGPREELAVSDQTTDFSIEVIPAVTVRCVRSALRQLLGKTPRTGQPLRTGQNYAVPDLSAIRLLVVEDNPVNQEIMAVLLEGTGVHIRMANNGQHALDILEQEVFDLIFLDIQMPDMDGYEAIRIIRERDLVLPVVALTAHAMQVDKQRCLDAGMDAYLSKPFKQTLLFDTIHTLLPELYRIPSTRTPQFDHLPSHLETSTQEADWSDLPPCFSVDIVRQTGLSPDQYPQILTSFARNHGQDGTAIRHSMCQRDWTALRDKAHALKGAAANLGARALRNAARALEIEAQLQLDRHHLEHAETVQPAGLLAAAVLDVETTLLVVLEAIARFCPTPARPRSTSISPLDSSGQAHHYTRLMTALRLATPDEIKAALATLLVTCDPVEYPLLQTLEDHVNDYDYDAALHVLETMLCPLPEQSSAPVERLTDAEQAHTIEHTSKQQEEEASHAD